MISRSPIPALDDKGLAKSLRQGLRQTARHDIGRATQAEIHDDPHRALRSGLRGGTAREDQRGCCEQDLAA